MSSLLFSCSCWFYFDGQFQSEIVLAFIIPILALIVVSILCIFFVWSHINDYRIVIVIIMVIFTTHFTEKVAALGNFL